MFKGMKWKFITIYFLLVLMAMIIVATFIVRNLESYNIEQISSTMKSSIMKLVNSSTSISESDNWNLVKSDIQKITKEWPISSSEMLYIVDATDEYKIVADTTSSKVIDRSIFEIKQVREDLIISCVKSGEIQKEVGRNSNLEGKSIHLTYPVLNETGQVRGIVYMITDLSDMYKSLEQSQHLLVRATAIALSITVLLGFLIAKSITEPIKDLTIKAEKMATGDFDQLVEVKSDDEIGRLASTFNYLTTQLKMTLSEVLREKNKLDIIFANMADGVILIDDKGYIIHINEVVTRMLKIPYSELLNSKYDDIFMELNKDVTLENIKKLNKIEGKENITIESSIYNLRYAIINNSKQELDAMIVVFQDITEQQKLDNMRKEFVADVSHELKTPITTIKSYTETLLDNDVDKEMSRQFLSVIDEECDRMTRIVRDLLQLSNFDFKQVNLNKEKLCMEDLLNRISLKVKISAQEKNQTIKMNISKNIPNVLADKHAIEQVVSNIITNAIKYTGHGGTIEIMAGESKGVIVVAVRDNGMGIPQGDLGRIFERFYRVDKARSRELGGTGLGLPIAKQIIETHGGSITIKSKYEVGTLVEILLPIDNIG